MSRLIAVIVAVLCLCSSPARAQAPNTVWLEDLTWTELRDLIRTGTTTIIIAVGGVEQSGPDVALGKHDVRARILSERIARALGHTLVAPVVAYVPEGETHPPTAHMRFPGTITVPPKVFREMLESAAASFALHGFRNIVLIGDHGGYQGDLAAVARDLNRQWIGIPARALFVPEYYRAATTDFYSVLKRHGYSAAEIGTHAGLADTSLTLAVDPRAVRAEALGTGTDLDAANGVYGDPRRSSAEMGRLAATDIVDKTVAAIRTDLSRNRP